MKNNSKEIKRELEEISPKLAEIEKKNPFKTPDYYFQSLPDKTLGVLKKQQTDQWTDRLEQLINNFFSFIFQPRYAVTFAIFLVVLAIGIGYFRGANDKSDLTRQLSQVSTEAIDTYVLENFDDYDLATLVNADEQVKLIPNNISNEDLIEYLNNNTVNQNFKEDYL